MRKLAIFAILIGLALPPGLRADPISALPVAGPMDGTEKVACVQGGATKQCPAAAIAALSTPIALQKAANLADVASAPAALDNLGFSHVVPCVSYLNNCPGGGGFGLSSTPLYLNYVPLLSTDPSDTLSILRNDTWTGGTNGQTTLALRVQMNCPAGRRTYCWTTQTQMNNFSTAADANQASAFANFCEQHSTGIIICSNPRISDLSGNANPTVSQVVDEIDYYGNGSDNNGARFNIDCHIGRPGGAGANLQVQACITAHTDAGSSFKSFLITQGANILSCALCMGAGQSIDFNYIGGQQRFISYNSGPGTLTYHSNATNKDVLTLYDTGGIVTQDATGGDPGAGVVNAQGYQVNGAALNFSNLAGTVARAQSAAGASACFTTTAVNLAAAAPVDLGPIAIPAQFANYRLQSALLWNASTTPGAASITFYSGVGATGTQLTSAQTQTGATTTDTIVAQTGLLTTQVLHGPNVYPRLTIANGSALTGNFTVCIQGL